VKALCIDLFCGLGGWTDGFLAEGYDVVGFDNHQHVYGEARYPAQLVIQDVLTLHGSQFAGAAVIVASPPCQNYSYMAMPWSRAKAMAAEIRLSTAKLLELNRLFWACLDIQEQASRAAGRHIPLVIENVKGAQPWVGPAKAKFGSFYLWGDVESVGGRVIVRPEFGHGIAAARRVAQKHNPDGTEHPQGSWFAIADSKNRGARKVDGFNFHQHEQTGQPGGSFQSAAVAATKNGGGSWFGVAHNTESGVGQNPATDKALDERRKAAGAKLTGGWFGSYAEQKAAGTISPGRLHGQNSDSRKAASAMIAKIPLDLARFIARSYKPELRRMA
jgi:C-5 cytosine-specific DNA methylase